MDPVNYHTEENWEENQENNKDDVISQKRVSF
jgi:hypothetical protein